MIAVAFCPHPPALVPALAPGADDVLDELREHVRLAVDDLLASGPTRVVVLAHEPDGGAHDQRAGGTLAGYGVDVPAGGDSPVLGLAHTVGAWLLDQVHWRGQRRYVSSHDVELQAGDALLVMADLSARRSLAAPGYVDDRAEAFDAACVAALAGGDVTALRQLDIPMADALMCGGARTLVEAARLLQANALEGDPTRTSVRYDAAPLGVGYVVANWLVAPGS